MHFFTGGVKLVTAGAQTVTATDKVTASITGTQSGINVKPSSVSQLALTTGTNASYTAMSPISIVVKEEDVYGNVVTTATDSVSVHISTDNTANGATLGGTTSVTASNGVASFSSLTINVVGTGYTLSGSVTPVATAYTVTTALFKVTAGSASALAFVQQPSSAQMSTALSPAVPVQIADSGRNNVASAGIGVTVALSANPGTATLSGTLTQTTDATGLATFSDLSLNRYAVGYSLSAVASSMSSATSSSFAISGQSVNPQQTIDFFDGTAFSTSSGAKNAGGEKFAVNPAYYSGTVTYTAEFIATNTDTNPATITITDNSGNSTGCLMTVPAGTVVPTRFTASFTPTNTPYYQVRMSQTTSSGQLTIHEGRILINQTNANSTASYIPMPNAGYGSGSWDTGYSTTWSQNTSGFYTSWTYDSSKFSTVTGFVVSSALSTSNGNTAYSGLWYVTAGAIVSGSICTVTNNAWHECEQSLPVSTLISGHTYQMMEMTSSSSQSVILARAGIYVQIQNLTHAQIYYRTMRSGQFTGSKNSAGEQSVQLALGQFSSGNMTLQCQAATSGGSATISLLDNGATPMGDAGPASANTATPLVASSAVTVSSSTSSILSSGNISITDGHIYLPYFSVTSVTLGITNCLAVTTM